MEFDRLLDAALKNQVPPIVPESVIAMPLADKVYLLSRLLQGVTILRKGKEDIVAQWSEEASAGVVCVIHEQGSPRRCGGQGDILAGNVAAAMHWALQVRHPLSQAMTYPFCRGRRSLRG